MKSSDEFIDMHDPSSFNLLHLSLLLKALLIDESDKQVRATKALILLAAMQDSRYVPPPEGASDLVSVARYCYDPARVGGSVHGYAGAFGNSGSTAIDWMADAIRYRPRGIFKFTGRSMYVAISPGASVDVSSQRIDHAFAVLPVAVALHHNYMEGQLKWRGKAPLAVLESIGFSNTYATTALHIANALVELYGLKDLLSSNLRSRNNSEYLTAGLRTTIASIPSIVRPSQVAAVLV
jgi:hypothetical protein